MRHEKIYMIGIGGIGMSALAQYLLLQGKEVRGMDRSESPTTELLRSKGIDVEIDDPLVGTLDSMKSTRGNIPDGTELLIYSDAVFPDHPVRKEATDKLIPELSYFQVLGDISKNMRTVAVAGTNGKTTTTGMLAKILEDAEASPSAIIGSIVRDFGSNFLPGVSDLFVVEACEYKNHLLELSPEILVITNVELDHTDFFPNIEAVVETFQRAVHKVPRNGVIIADPSALHVAQVLSGAVARVVDYTQMAIGELKLPGEFNRMNASAALAAARAALPSLSLESGVRSLSQFQGSWRRFEYKGETARGAEVYDDYAHHPTAIVKTILAAREKFSGKRIVVAFHPHLYSRTRSFMDEFARALAQADFTIVAPIFAAREAHDPTVSHRILAEKIRDQDGEAAALDTFDEIRAVLERENAQTVIFTMGAGDIYKVAEQIILE